MQITVKKPHFEAKVRNSVDNLETRYEWFMNWKDKDLDYTENCVFIDEAGFHINMRNNWARSPAGTRAVVKTAKIRVTSHLVIGAIHSSAVLHVVLKKPPPKPELDTVAKKKRKGNSGKKRGVAETTNDDEGTKEDDTSVVDVKLAPKGTTTAHFIKFVNELLNIRDEDESLKGSYLVIDNASIHKSKPMIRKIKARYYKFWALVKGKMKRHRLMKEETLSSRIGDACNNVRFSDLYGFCLHSKHQIINCFKRTPF